MISNNLYIIISLALSLRCSKGDRLSELSVLVTLANVEKSLKPLLCLLMLVKVWESHTVDAYSSNNTLVAITFHSTWTRAQISIDEGVDLISLACWRLLRYVG